MAVATTVARSSANNNSNFCCKAVRDAWRARRIRASRTISGDDDEFNDTEFDSADAAVSDVLWLMLAAPVAVIVLLLTMEQSTVLTPCDLGQLLIKRPACRASKATCSI